MGKAKLSRRTRRSLAVRAAARKVAQPPIVIENEVDTVRDAIEEAANKMTFEQYVEFMDQLNDHVSSCHGAAIDPAHCFHRLKGDES